MARILFTWELGGGMGHVAPYLPLIDKLRQAGHEVAFALRNLQFAELTLGKAGIPYFQAPVMQGKAGDEITTPHSFAQILHNVGYGDPGLLVGLARAWHKLFSLYRPDLVVFDHSPTALMAARTYPCRKVVIGNGFFIPPVQSGIPILRKEPSPYLANVQRDEERILATINGVIEKMGGEPLTTIPQLYEADEQVITTFREIDHFSDRRQRGDSPYWGPLGHTSIGVAPQWPAGEGKRIYGYLKPFAALPTLLEQLKRLGVPTLIYAPQVGDQIKRRFECDTLHFSSQPLDLNRVAAECDLAITHGTHATCCTFLLAGKPMLMLPLYLEQRLIGDNIQELGAGLSAPLLHPQGIAQKLQTLLANGEKYGRAAQAFAERYNDFDAGAVEQRLLQRIETLLRDTT
ncbi:MAG: hypothetical protein OQK94_07745 [Gammaproteobacteria bacterium]|nr:hypothetical protein [Gammaproteobacteria bacterium]MCW8840764.1 hypothetical protein [Gammaproteobacteria bacterium]MCW8958743.1 hypothetical protein [Gammaproteobacteria bacterium]MCW8973622.1 hypothetical protein [Gammaproteobacteria bacterium]MCW8993754.1 hypothetical protein [Gammaproteobacteria bacterium]